MLSLSKDSPPSSKPKQSIEKEAKNIDNTKKRKNKLFSGKEKKKSSLFSVRCVHQTKQTFFGGKKNEEKKTFGGAKRKRHRCKHSSLKKNRGKGDQRIANERKQKNKKKKKKERETNVHLGRQQNTENGSKIL